MLIGDPETSVVRDFGIISAYKIIGEEAGTRKGLAII